MQGEFGQQSVETPFAADDPDRFIQFDGRAQESIARDFGKASETPTRNSIARPCGYWRST